MFYIYKITNNINNKIYIGKTSRDIETRFKEHINESLNLRKNSNSKIHHAMAKYGINNFQVSLIEEVEEDKELLNLRERYWINFYNSIEEGYNLATGGQGCSLSDEQIMSIKKCYDEGLNCKEISEKLNLSHSTVYHRVANYEDYDANENRKKAKKEQYKPITVYTYEGEKIKDYISISEAATDLGLEVSAISGALKNHYSAKKYRFAYLNEELIINTNKKIVEQYDLNGNYIQSFEGAREAGRITGINYTGISKTCNGKQRSSGGYIWKYAE